MVFSHIFFVKKWLLIVQAFQEVFSNRDFLFGELKTLYMIWISFFLHEFGGQFWG